MLRISVTSIEKYRRFMAESSPFDTEAALLETLKGTFTGNPKTVVGGAFHKIIEGDFQDMGTHIFSDGVYFTQEQAAPALKYRVEHPLITHEMNVNRIYETKYFPIQATGRVDCTEGMWIRDAKAKFRDPGDFQDYEESCQWKFYCHMLDVHEFFYDLFEVKGFDDEKSLLGARAPYTLDPSVAIIAHDPFPCVIHDDPEHELITLLNDFLDYIYHRNLIHLLKPALYAKEL